MRNRSTIDVTVSHNATFTEVVLVGRREECYRWVSKAIRATDYLITENPIGLVCEYNPRAALELRAGGYRNELAELKAELPELIRKSTEAPDLTHAQALRGVKHPDVEAELTARRAIQWLETGLSKLDS